MFTLICVLLSQEIYGVKAIFFITPEMSTFGETMSGTGTGVYNRFVSNCFHDQDVYFLAYVKYLYFDFDIVVR